MKWFYLTLLVLGFDFAQSREARAEPWLSTRYAQNCAGCHAPGRKNLKPIDRRCSLSCQGCHVNPNGGGMRSFYGKWTEDRWLRTFWSEKLKHKKNVALITKQRYRTGSPKYRRKFNKKAVTQKGFQLVEQTEHYADEMMYDRRDGLEKVTARDRDEWMFQVPRDDPYRLMDESRFDLGLDYRHQVASIEPEGSDKMWLNFPMTLDLGVRWRPFNRKLHLVYETRAYGSAREENKFESMLTQNTTTRALYAMVDDLPYNIFVMGGYYRVLIGNYVPDHTALQQKFLGSIFEQRSEALNFQAVSVGTAPNVPYGNFHLIQKQIKKGDPDNAMKGFAANLGLRFVTLGGSINYTYFKTKDERATRSNEIEIQTIGGAANYGIVTASLEGMAFKRDLVLRNEAGAVEGGGLVEGGVVTLDTLVQLWRSNYFNFQIAKGNTSINLRPGDILQMKFGIRSFLMPGFEIAFSYDTETNELYPTNEEDPGQETKTKVLSGQIHVFL